MPQAAISKSDIEHSIREGHHPMEAAAHFGTSHNAIRRAEGRYGVRLPRRREKVCASALREYVEGLTASEAIEHLLFVVDELTGATCDEVGFWPNVSLTVRERSIFQALYSGRIWSRSKLMSALYPSSDDQPEPKIIDVYLCKLRKKIGPLGFQVVAHWGVGWSMSVAPDAAQPWLARD